MSTPLTKLPVTSRFLSFDLILIIAFTFLLSSFVSSSSLHLLLYFFLLLHLPLSHLHLHSKYTLRPAPRFTTILYFLIAAPLNGTLRLHFSCALMLGMWRGWFEGSGSDKRALQSQSGREAWQRVLSNQSRSICGVLYHMVAMTEDTLQFPKDLIGGGDSHVRWHLFNSHLGNLARVCDDGESL